MKQGVIYSWAAAVLLLAAMATESATADDGGQRPQLSRQGGVLTNSPIAAPAASRDTIYLLGAPGAYDGRFQAVDGSADWHGWTSVDVTAPSVQRWNADQYNAENLGGPDNYAAWCGADYAPCSPEDPAGGYGNNWNEKLDFWAEAPNPDQATTVTINFDANFDTEPAFDFVKLGYQTSVSDDSYETVYISEGDNQHQLGEYITFVVEPLDYLDNSDLGLDHAIHLQWTMTSTGNGSDADCIYASRGACQIDNLQVKFNGNEVSFDDFEDGPYPADTLGNWTVSYPVGVGDYAYLWRGLQDLDPCRSNGGYQVGFIDYPDLLPGSSGQQCITWCYGPGGYIVNTQGGFAGPQYHLANDIVSPPLPWADQNLNGASYTFEVYRHEDLRPVVSPGIFYVWGVRSISQQGLDEEQAQLALEFKGWKNRNLIQYGDPAYLRQTEVVPDLLEPGRTWVQLKLGAYELGWLWSYVGDDGYPAPYFDNVAFATYSWEGPGIAAREVDLAQDTFPELGVIDFATPLNNWCRFDMARNVAPANVMSNDPGDSILFDITALRAGSQLNGIPRLYFKILYNPLFPPADRAGNQWGHDGDFISGQVEGYPARQGDFPPVPHRWAFDLPDTALLYPGDVLHYYVRAEDEVGGDIQVSTFPLDTTGFSDFTLLSAYNISNEEGAQCKVNCLPSLASLTPGDQPKILFWNDYADLGGQNKWYYAFLNNGLTEEDFDLYYTNAPAAGAGNGLGGRATAAQLAGYDVLLYTSGDLSNFTLCNGDFNADPSRDIQVLNLWLASGDKNAFFTGDNLAYDLSTVGPAGSLFLSNRLSVQLEAKAIYSHINNQATPTVHIIEDNSIWSSLDHWVAYGSCPFINQFDAVTPIGANDTCAEFLTPNGEGSVYDYTAGTYHLDVSSNNRIVYLPYDLMYIYTPQDMDYGDPVSARALVLRDVLLRFSVIGSGELAVPEAGVFAAHSYPNPFNPRTTIAFELARRGQVSLKIYNLRGELVRCLVDEVRPAAAYAEVWDGTDTRGGRVSSGIYFYELKSDEGAQVGKMALVK